MIKRVAAIVALVVIVVIALWFIYIRLVAAPAGDQQVVDPGGSQPGNGGPGGVVGGGGPTVSLQTKDGGSVSVPDFTQGKMPETVGSSQYYSLVNTDDSNPTYHITYTTDSTVSLTLYSEPLGAARFAAEQALRNYFPLSDQQLCALKTSVYVPTRVNEFYAGRDLGLSFCPGATPLPN